MSVISIVGTAFCSQTAVSRELSVYSGYRAVDFKEVLTKAVKTLRGG